MTLSVLVADKLSPAAVDALSGLAASTPHIGASTDQDAEAIAAEIVRVVET